MKGERLSEAARRDLELMLLGACAIRDGSEAVFKSIGGDILSSDSRKLIEAVKRSIEDKQVDPLIREWLEERTVKMEPGDTALTAIVRALEREADLACMKRSSDLLSRIARVGTRESYIAELKETLSKLEPSEKK